MPPPPGVDLRLLPAAQDQQIAAHSAAEVLAPDGPIGSAVGGLGGGGGGWRPEFFQAYVLVLTDGTLIRGYVRSS